MHDTIRVWSREGRRHDWHVSVGDRSPLALLREAGRAAGLAERQEEDRLGLAWDEALEAVVLAMVAPGSLRRRALDLEPPTGSGWMILAEIQPLSLSEYRVRSRSEECDRLTLGEALAMVVRWTFPREWPGFQTERLESFALERRTA